MMHKEFEQIAGIEVTYEDYTNIIEPMYMALNLSKQEFVKTLNLKFFTDRMPKPEKNIKRMLVRNRVGESKTPNGCYYYIEFVELVEVVIRTGKYVIKPLEEEDFQKLREEGRDLGYGYDYDMDYTQCVDTKKKPIELSWIF